MTRSLILPASQYDLGHLPSNVPFSKRFAFLPNVRAWFDGSAGTVVRNSDNRVIEWQARIGNSRFTRASNYANANPPLFVPNAYRDRNAIRFTRAHMDAMIWSGQTETGAGSYTMAFIVDLRPQTQGTQFIASDLSPTWRTLNMTRDQYGGVDLSASAGVDGAVGTSQAIGPLTNIGRPVLIVAVFDGFYNQVKLRVNNRQLTFANGNPIMSATDIYLGAGGFASNDPLGVDMDVYGMWFLRDDLLAEGREGHMASMSEYALTFYDIY